MAETVSMNRAGYGRTGQEAIKNSTIRNTEETKPFETRTEAGCDLEVALFTKPAAKSQMYNIQNDIVMKVMEHLPYFTFHKITK